MTILGCQEPAPEYVRSAFPRHSIIIYVLPSAAHLQLCCSTAKSGFTCRVELVLYRHPKHAGSQGSGQNDVHAVLGMSTIIPSTGSSQVLTSEAFVI
jgi:hypothetical protein